MNRREPTPRVYRSKRPIRAAVTALICILAACIILFVILFFSLKSRIAYDGDKLYLDIPWISGELEEYRN